MLRRRLVKSRYSFQLNLPKDFMLNLGWKPGDTIYVRQRGKQGLYIDRLLTGQLSPPRKKRPLI